MFKRPEELIVAALAALWVVLTYLLGHYSGAPWQINLLVSALTLIWAAACFILWQRNLSRAIWPFFLGLLVACWWPYIDWAALDGLADAAAAVPWYATWTFKIILAVIPVLAGYAVKWKLHRKYKTID